MTTADGAQLSREDLGQLCFVGEETLANLSGILTYIGGMEMPRG
ncbi:hypothetical protein [Sorangium sp. So ce131]